MDLFPRAQTVDIPSEAAPATVLERLRALVSGWPRSTLAPAGRAAGIYGWILDERDPRAFVLRPRPLRDPRFVADTHLGKLARHLRMAGFDTLYGRDWDDERIVALAAAERRTILTRDRALLRRREVQRGYCVRAVQSEAQLAEVISRLQLEGLLAPFTRCRECNVALEEAAREAVGGHVPEKVRGLYPRFKRCPSCARVYWEGSHYARMRGILERALGESR